MNTAVLNWHTTGATTVTINGSAVAHSGSAQLVINAATTYTLVASGPGRCTASAHRIRSGQHGAVELAGALTGDIPAGYVIEAGSGPGLVDIGALRLGNVLTFATTAPPGVGYVRIRAVGADGIAGEASNEIVVRK